MGRPSAPVRTTMGRAGIANAFPPPSGCGCAVGLDQRHQLMGRQATATQRPVEMMLLTINGGDRHQLFAGVRPSGAPTGLGR
jgi:hypothetical protein